ncbi:MAG: hypothetical protein GF417_00820 [Candidatus Latescibacteria bacterium]|nr:hypothetical protein [bacterium]MBD3422969.1 hypothetical protein [Candidatus Latescibacterota bacterium]
MDRREKFIKRIKKQLFPYKSERDIDSEGEKWGVSDEDYLTSWIRMVLVKCQKHSRCAEKQMCEYFSYSDIARENYRICSEMILMLESGEIKCSFED